VASIVSNKFNGLVTSFLNLASPTLKTATLSLKFFYHKTYCRQVSVGKVVEKHALKEKFNFECVVSICRTHSKVVDVKLSQKFCPFVRNPAWNECGELL